jgi:hypothetical protein
MDVPSWILAGPMGANIEIEEAKRESELASSTVISWVPKRKERLAWR